MGTADGERPKCSSEGICEVKEEGASASGNESDADHHLLKGMPIRQAPPSEDWGCNSVSPLLSTTPA